MSLQRSSAPPFTRVLSLAAGSRQSSSGFLGSAVFELGAGECPLDTSRCPSVRTRDRYMEGMNDLSDRLTALRRAVSELTLVVETIAEMVAASGIAAARDLLSPEEADDVATQMREHILIAKEALHQSNRP